MRVASQEFNIAQDLKAVIRTRVAVTAEKKHTFRAVRFSAN